MSTLKSVQETLSCTQSSKWNREVTCIRSGGTRTGATYKAVAKAILSWLRRSCKENPSLSPTRYSSVSDTVRSIIHLDVQLKAYP